MYNVSGGDLCPEVVSQTRTNTFGVKQKKKEKL